MSVPPLFLRQLFLRKCSVFSGLSFLLYDHMITLPLEVQHIWKAPWTIVKAGFLLNRYGNMIGQTFIMLEETGYLNPSEKFCGFFRVYCTFFIVFSVESIRILILMRAWAIWGYRCCAVVSLIMLHILYILSMIGALVYSSYTSTPLAYEYVSQVGVCVGPIDPYIWLIWLATLVLDSVVLAMVWYCLRKLFKESHALYPSPLIPLLLRDAVLFYAVSVFNSVFSIVCWTVFRQDPRCFLHIALSTPLLSVTGQRFILNLREFQARPFTARDLSREVDRQIAAFGWECLGTDLEADIKVTNTDQNGNSTKDPMTGTADPGLELMEVRRSQGSPTTISSLW